MSDQPNAETPAYVVCACCEMRSADVTLRVEFADAVDVSPWCMDCAADVVSMELATVVESV